MSSALATVDRFDELRSQIDEIAALQAPLRRVVAELCARCVDTSVWHALGFARLRDYADERLGLAQRTVQDLARVARALAALPGLDAALTRRELGWTQVRLLARVATPEDEQHWIARARTQSVRALEKLVRRVDVGSVEAGALQAEAGPRARETVAVRCTPGVRSQWWRTRQAASRVAGRRLSPWEAMDLVAAEVSSWRAPEPDPERLAFAATASALRREPLRTGADLPGGAPPPALPEPLRPLVAGLAEADAPELDRRLQRAVALSQQLEARLAPLLLEVVEGRRFRGWGFPSFAAYVRECLPMSQRRADALLRIERAAAVCPPLRDAFRTARISWVRAQALVPVALAQNADAAAWVERAGAVSVHQLEDEVEDAADRHAHDPSRFPDPPAADAPPLPVDDRVVQMRAQSTGSGETARPFWTGPRDAARFFRAVLCSVRRALERERGHPVTEGEAFGAMLDHALSAWGWGTSKVPKRYRVFARDGWRCTVPGCSSHRNLQDHHIVFRSRGGGDEEENRTTLCAWHHQRGVHGGAMTVEGKAPAGLEFEVEKGTGGLPID